MPGHFGPLCFDDADDYVPFKHGQMKPFKKQLSKHARESGNSEIAQKMAGFGKRVKPDQGDKKSRK